MQIEKKYGVGILPALATISADTTVAKEHASLFPTQMALARWTRGGDIPHVHASERNMPMRAGWYTQAQAQFQAWIDAGGFHQAEPVCRDCALRAEHERDRLAVDEASAAIGWSAPE